MVCNIQQMNRLPLLSVFLLVLLCSGCQPRAQHPRQLPIPIPSGIELPEHTADEDIVVHLAYTASYNHTTLCPDWVAWELTADEACGTIEQQRQFSRDPSVRFPKASREDYSQSGWDKGHMAPHADMKWSRQAMTESDYFTNICPQDRAMNAGAWRKIEELTRRLAIHYGSVFVICGPIYISDTPRLIGEACVQVPDQFFKALAINKDGQYHTVAFLMDNTPQNRSPRHYALSVDEIETILSRNLFPLVPEEAETHYDWNTWNH